MKQISSLIVAVVLVGLFAAQAQAANTITLSTATSPMAGQIKGDGSYNLDMGYAVLSITLKAGPVGGGLLRPINCTHDRVAQTFTGQTAGLDPTLTYDVWAEMRVLQVGTPNEFVYVSHTLQKQPNGQ